MPTNNSCDYLSPIAISSGGTNASSFGTSNGVVKFDGTRLVSSSAATYNASNYYNNTAQPCFRAYASTAQNSVTGNNTEYTVQFKTSAFDQASSFDGTSTFTAPVTGKYFLQYQIGIAQVTTSFQAIKMEIYVASNSVAVFYGNAGTMQIGNYITTSISTVINMLATNTAYCAINVSGSTQTINIQTGNNNTFFSGYLIC